MESKALCLTVNNFKCNIEICIIFKNVNKTFYSSPKTSVLF